MNVTIHPGRVQGSIAIPPSKSIAHRAIVCASLAKGRSTISSIDFSDDILATIGAMRQLGASIEAQNDRLLIDGIDFLNAQVDAPIDCKESGSTLRFLIPLLGLLAQPTTFHGRNRLLKRPQEVYQTIFHSQDLLFALSEDELNLQGPLQPGEFVVRGDSSSQFISGLLLSLPLLGQDSRIEVIGPFESKSYVDLTIATLASFGIKIVEQMESIDMENDHLTNHEMKSINASTIYRIAGNQHYQATDYTVEGDYSQLAFFGVLGAIQGPIECTGMQHNSKQGDQIILAYLKQCGIPVDETNDGYVFHPSAIHGATLDLKDCPDLGPILMILGMFASSPMKFIHANRLRLKESDRIEAMAEGLQLLGVEVHTSEDEVVVVPKPLPYEGGVVISGHKDHRIVMSFAIAATMARLPITITDGEAIAKSFPSFFKELNRLGIEVQYD